MPERDIDPGDTDMAAPRRPKILFSRRNALLFVGVSYVFAVVLAGLLLGTVEFTQGYDDYRNIQATLIFAGVMVVPFGLAMFNVSRSS